VARLNSSYQARIQDLSQPTSKLVPVRQQNEVGNYEAPDFEIIEEPKQESASNQTSLKNIAGLEKAKQILMEAIILPRKFPYLYSHLKPWNKLLLYGVSYSFYQNI
jgi:ATP-dependent 26S proteasome regulatory subunit